MSPNLKGLGGFPGQWHARLKYVQLLSMTPVSNSSVSNQFRLNSLYDPDETGTGRQPDNYDQFMRVYNRYSVSKVRFRVSQAWNSTSSIAPSWMGALVSASGSQVSGFSNVEQLMEQRNIVYSEVGTGNANTAPWTGRVQGEVSISDWVGVHGESLLLGDYSATDGANPARGPKLEVFLYSFGTSTGTANPLKVEMEFDCTFFDIKIGLPSTVEALKLEIESLSRALKKHSDALEDKLRLVALQEEAKDEEEFFTSKPGVHSPDPLKEGPRQLVPERGVDGVAPHEVAQGDIVQSRGWFG